MHATTFLFAAIGGLAAAQTSTVASGCGTSIDLIIQNCLGTQTQQLKMCAANDWDCMCTQQTNVLTCYNNCPSAPNKFGAEQQQISWCGAAKAYGKSASSSLVATVTPSANAGLAAASAPASTTAATSSAAAPTHSGNAAPIVAPATGLFAVILGVAALL